MKHILKKMASSLLVWEARRVLAKFKPCVVAVTGSVGKTTTKDAIYMVLSSRLSARKSEKSYNSEIGIPLTILGLQSPWRDPLAWVRALVRGFRVPQQKEPYPDWLVLEAGIDRPGDMRRIARWLVPDVVVLTRFPDVPVHVEYFATPEAVIAEKCELVRALVPDGLLVVNYDDPKTRTAVVRNEQKKITYGLGKGADVQARALTIAQKNGLPVGMEAIVRARDTEATLVLPGVLGVQPVYSALGGVAVGVGLSIPLEDMVSAIALLPPTPGRMRILSGIHETTLIDDSYNSSPVALAEALAALAKTPARGRKIAVIGDMLELGRFSVQEHRRAGELASKTANLLVTVGIRSRATATVAREHMGQERVYECRDSYEAAQLLKTLVNTGDLILIKGSQGVRTERVTAALLADASKAEELLVRQEEEWRTRV